MDDPSAAPAAGDTDFTHGVLMVAIIPMIASTTTVGFRLANRAWTAKAWGWDDYIMMFAATNI